MLILPHQGVPGRDGVPGGPGETGKNVSAIRALGGSVTILSAIRSAQHDLVHG